MRRALLAAGLLILLAACDLSMRRQARYDAQSQARLWADGLASRPIPSGVVTTDDALIQASATQPPVADAALLQRGRERFAVFCTPCHGETGRGDGRVVQRGFPTPPDYASPRVQALSGQEIYTVISNGYGLMYPYADRIPPPDRWAIVAYVRALQTAADQPASAVPAGATPLEAAR